MARILLFLVVAFAAWLVVRQIGGARKRPDAPASPLDRAPASTNIESTAQCAWCGVHVPRGDAVALPDGRVYCGVAHRDAARVAAPIERDGA